VCFMTTLSQRQFSSFSDYVRLGYERTYVTANSVAGSQGIGLVKLVQGSGSFPGPSVPDLYIACKKWGFLKGRVALGGDSFDMSVPSHVRGFSVTPPDTAIDVELEGHYEFNVVAIPGGWARSLLEPYKAATSLDFGKLHLGVQQDKAVFRLVEQLHHTSTLESNNALLVDGLVMALLGRLVTLSEMKNKPRTIRPLDKFVLTQVESCLQEDLCTNPTMQDLANLAGMSVDHFGKSFKKATGQTPYQYILERRLERAKTLLKDSRLSLVEVALAVGFASQAHMNKLFKQHFDVSPGVYRKQLN
jgi:AraC-like DNA-binding protein